MTHNTLTFRKALFLFLVAVLGIFILTSCGSSKKAISKSNVKTDSFHVVKSNKTEKVDSSHTLTKDSSFSKRMDSSGTTKTKEKNTYERNTTILYGHDSTGKTFPISKHINEKGIKEKKTQNNSKKTDTSSGHISSNDSLRLISEMAKNKIDSEHLKKSEVIVQKQKVKEGISIPGLLKWLWLIIPILLLILIWAKNKKNRQKVIEKIWKPFVAWLFGW